jgi:hypothetical protein
MFRLPASLTLLLLLAGAGCGHKIGDECSVSSDCASDGTRVCDIFSPGGSCTIEGCDFKTCPEDSVCVRFFPSVHGGKPCAGPAECAADEVCTVGNYDPNMPMTMQCAPRSLEQRFCMATCSGDGDCREAYECRDEAKMRRHGGEPVPDPETGTANTTNFCASRRPCIVTTDCEGNDVCDIQSRICMPR